MAFTDLYYGLIGLINDQTAQKKDLHNECSEYKNVQFRMLSTIFSLFEQISPRLNWHSKIFSVSKQIVEL